MLHHADTRAVAVVEQAGLLCSVQGTILCLFAAMLVTAKVHNTRSLTLPRLLFLSDYWWTAARRGIVIIKHV